MKALFLQSAIQPLTIVLVEIINDKVIEIDRVKNKAIVNGLPSETFFYGVEQLRERNNLEYAEIDRIFIASGPGSYTGARLAVTIAKTIAVFCEHIELYDVSLLSIYQRMSVISQKRQKKDGICLALVYARKNKLYVQATWDQKILLHDSIRSFEEVEQMFSAPCYVNGQYIDKQVTNLEDMLTRKLDLLIWYQLSQKVEDIHEYEPYYLESVTIG